MEGKPTKSTGRSVLRMIGGFWQVDDFTAEFMGMPFAGHGTTGYDPMKGKYVGTWIDSMNPSMMLLEGNYDASGKVMTMSGMGIGMDGQPAMHRMVTTEKDANTAVFEMFVVGPEGKEMKMMTITYTRSSKAEKDGKRGGGDHGGDHGGQKR